MEDLEKRVEKLERQLEVLQNKLGCQPHAREKGKSQNMITIKGDYHREHTGSHFELEFGLDKVFDDFQAYADIFASFGSVERLKVIDALLDDEKTAKEIMESAGMRTTGQVYHHLDDLEKIGLISKQGDKYKINSSYISTIALLYSGANYLKYKADKYGKSE